MSTPCLRRLKPDGTYVSLSPIWTTLNPADNNMYVSEVMVAAFHLGYDNTGAPYFHLNDNVPGDPMFTTMWQEVATLQSYGVTVRMMPGAAAQGSYQDLFSAWSTMYPTLQEKLTLANAEMLVNRLDADFGSQFKITLSPVASAHWGGANLSGISYQQLYANPAGPKIAWFNGQFYSGFATLASTSDYVRAVQAGFPADKVVGGMIANPNDGSGYVPIATVSKTVKSLVGQYAHFGGVAAWEYFNALPGNTSNPIQWVDMAKAQR